MPKEGNGVFNYQGINTGKQLIDGGYTQFVSLFFFLPSCSFKHHLQMLAAIGETFETPYTSTSSTNPLAPATAKDEVTGVIVSSRKAFYRVNIWTRTSDSKERVLDIGKHFKFGVLGVPEGKKLTGPQAANEGKSLASEVEFVSHEASQTRGKGKGFTV